MLRKDHRLSAKGDILFQLFSQVSLFHRMAFQYNGDVWHDVHPLVSEMPKFREAMKPSGPKKKASRD